MLKQLLQLLLNTRTTPSEAAHNAAPGRIDIGISGQEYICPADGFVTASANAKNVGGFDMQLFRNGLSVQGGPQEVSVPAWTQAAMIPVAKGDTVNISLYNQNSWQWRFISSIGMEGGGKFVELLYGGSVCLRALSHFSLKNSLLAEATGFPTNPIQLFKRRISHLQQQENGFQLSLLATGGSASKELPRKFCLATGRFGKDVTQQRHLIRAFVSLSQKAGMWPTYCRQTPRAHSSSLFQVSAINSFQTGGALC